MESVGGATVRASGMRGESYARAAPSDGARQRSQCGAGDSPGSSIVPLWPGSCVEHNCAANVRLPFASATNPAGMNARSASAASTNGSTE